MSGSFEQIDVPPTLVSFAIGVQQAPDIITPEFKQAENRVYLLRPQYNEQKLPDFDSLRKLLNQTYQLAQSGKLLSACALGFGGTAEAIAKMCFGN